MPKLGQFIPSIFNLRIKNRVRYGKINLGHPDANKALSERTNISPIVKYGGNQAQRLRQGALIKKMGYEKGTLDIFIPKARGLYHGLFIELKTADGSVQPEQTAMAESHREEGYCAAICRGYAEAVNVIDKYMAGKNI